MNLELRHEDSGPRHYLDGRPVHCGEQLRLKVSSGAQPEFWIWARYEASMSRHGNGIGVILETVFGRVLPNEGTTLRWPREGET